MEPLHGPVTTLVATRHGTVRPGVRAVVEARGDTVAGVLTTEADEDNQYGLPPGLVEDLADGVAATGTERVVVDGLLHPGKHYDLQNALPPVELLDRRDLYYAHLSDGANKSAERARELRRVRLEYRAAKRRQRDGETAGPAGESGPVADLERARDRLATDLDGYQARQRQGVEESYDGVDAHAVVVGPVGAATTDAWATLTREHAESAALRPATPTTAVLEVGPHELAVTDTPGLVTGQPEWFTAAVPGTIAALERADVVVVVDGDQLLDIDTMADGTVLRTRSPGDESRQAWRDELTTEIQQELPTTHLAITLPYGAESLVSSLYDEASVETIEYDEEITATVAVPAGRSADIERRVETAGGTAESSE